jgi:hypothetical protein
VVSSHFWALASPRWPPAISVIGPGLASVGDRSDRSEQS